MLRHENQPIEAISLERTTTVSTTHGQFQTHWSQMAGEKMLQANWLIGPYVNEWHLLYIEN